MAQRPLPEDLPDDLPALAAALSAREAARPRLRPGLGAEIVFANPGIPARTRFALVYLHGFSASKGETRPLPDKLARTLGANLYFPRLSGHGEDAAALAAAHERDWLTEARAAVEIGRRLGEQVILMATSTGGTLVPFLLLDPLLAPRIAAAILIAPNFGLASPGAPLLTLPCAGRLLPLLLGPTRSFLPQNDLQQRFWTNDYPVAALLPMARLVRRARHLPVERIATPCLFYYDPGDRIVSARATERIFRRWGGPKERAAPGPVEDPNRHVIAGDAYAPSGTAPALATMTAFLEHRLGPLEKESPETAASR